MKIEPSEFLPIGNEFQKIFGISFGKLDWAAGWQRNDIRKTR